MFQPIIKGIWMDIPGGRRPVTVTAYTPGLKLPWESTNIS